MKQPLSALTLAAISTCVALFTGCDDLFRPPPPPLTGEPNSPEFPEGDVSTPDPGDASGADDPLTVTAVEPGEGLAEGGVDIMLSGTGFIEGIEVFFGEAPAPEVFVIGPTTAIARLPPHPSGRVDVMVTRARTDPAILPLSFRYYQPMIVGTIMPGEGPIDGGTPVTVSGRGFTQDTRFFIGGRLALNQRVIDGETLAGLSPPGRFGVADVHAVGVNGTAVLDDGFRFGRPPELLRLAPPAGPAEGGTELVLEGVAFGDQATVLVDGVPADVVAWARDGSALTVLTPPLAAPLSGTRLVDVTVATAWGASTLAEAFAYRGAIDPLLLACSHLVPARGQVGDTVELACTGLSYGDIEVRFGPAPAGITAVDAPGSLLSVAVPAGSGVVEVEVRTAAADWVSAGSFSYEPAPRLAVDSIAPASGPIAGGTRITLHGRGFGPSSTVQVGAFIATSVAFEDAGTLSATTPPGAPGLADVIVRDSGAEARLTAAFDYGSDQLTLDLIAPATAARSGGTWLRVYGQGFSDTTEVLIGGVPCEVIERTSSAELAVRSPKLAVGVYDAEVRDRDPAAPFGGDGAGSSMLARALVSFDPRSGTGGTRGGPIDETLNVTVWGSGGYGAVAGAFVLVGNDPEGPWRGITDENGQVTLSGPGLYGPLEVTASRDGFTAYSVIVFDAMNVTVLLSQNPVPPQPGGGGNPVTPPPNALILGRVLGLDKYVVAPPASCEAKAIAETLHCAACDPSALDGGCDGTPGFTCIDIGDQGPHCAAACSVDADCQSGYACQGSLLGARCLPSAGHKRAYCNISSPSLFGYEYPLQESGWVDADGNWALDSRRLGELAIYCFGGYEDEAGVFTPTVMGIHRNLFAGPGATIDGLAIELTHPLRRSFRLRLQDPPTWPTGLSDPTITISLDLGPDGAIPFSRSLVPVGDHTFVAPHQLTALARELYNAHYFIYSTLAPEGVSGNQPRSYNLVQHVQSIVEDRLPVRDAAGWRLTGAQIERDLYGIYQAPPDASAGVRIWAVGEAGTLLLYNGNGWTAQTSFTDESLRCIDGTGGEDVWTLGEDGTARHWDGLAWQTVAAPEDDYEAVLATPDAIYAAGAIRLRRLDRASGEWLLEGAPLVQGVRGFVKLPGASGGRVLALGTGRMFLSGLSEPGQPASWEPIATAPGVTLRAGLVRQVGQPGELVIVGDDGTLLAGPSPDALTEIPVPTYADLTALAEEADGTLVIVGDDGVALRGREVGDLALETIPDYRSKAYGIVVSDDVVHVVGSAAFILGPFLHFPIVTAPLHEADVDSLAFAWTWDGGPANQYTRLALTPDASITVWTLIVDGAQQVAILPDLEAAAGLSRLAPGRYRLDLLRVLNRNFDIDNYTTRDFNLYARDAWATNEAYFYLP